MRANNGVCENFVRYTEGDGNFLRCIATNIENGNPFLNWYANQCYGSKTCDSAQLAYGGMAVDLECLSMFQDRLSPDCIPLKNTYVNPQIFQSNFREYQYNKCNYNNSANYNNRGANNNDHSRIIIDNHTR